MRPSLRVSSLVLSAALLGCSEPTAPPTACNPFSQVELTVGFGPTPSISWKPNCLVGEIYVRRLDGPTSTTGTAIWFVLDPSNSIERGIIFGSLGTPSETLQPGQTYEVFVGVVVGGDASSTVGSVRFTR